MPRQFLLAAHPSASGLFLTARRTSPIYLVRSYWGLDTFRQCSRHSQFLSSISTQERTDFHGPVGISPRLASLHRAFV